MTKILIALALPPLLLFVTGLLRPELIIGASPFGASMAWSLIGSAISYLGFVFSLFAVLEGSVAQIG